MRRREFIALLGGATVADIRDIRITNDEKRAGIKRFPERGNRRELSDYLIKNASDNVVIAQVRLYLFRIQPASGRAARHFRSD